MNARARTVAALALLPAASLPALAQCGPAVYELVFDAEWSQATHPAMFPGDPHFSPLIGATHGPAAVFWSPGGLASPGIESMAETGAVTTLRNEVPAAIDQETAWSVLQGGGVAVSPGQRSLTFNADPGFPQVTLVTMIAPSPDWFVGVAGLDLRAGGSWTPSVTVDLGPWDAGTDSGTTYTSPNADTNPPEPIHSLAGLPPFAGTGRLGTMTFTLVSRGGCSLATWPRPAACTTSSTSRPT